MNQRIQKVDLQAPKNQQLLQNIQNKFGKVPNIFATMAQAPAVLDAFTKYTSALSQGQLSHQIQETIALAMAGRHQCHYCAAAHSLSAKGAHFTPDDIHNNLKGKSRDHKTQAAISFVYQILDAKGHISDQDFQDIKQAGYSDGEIIEILATTVLNMMTNFFNSAFKTELDFPKVDL